MKKYIYDGKLWKEFQYPEKNYFVRNKNIIFQRFNLNKKLKNKNLNLKILNSLNEGYVGYEKSLKLQKMISDNSEFFNYLKFANKLSVWDYPVFHQSGLFQLYSNSSIKISPKLLICFTGDMGQLNMPIPVFHSVAKEYFDGIAYFFCPDKDRYQKNYLNVMTSIGLLLKLKTWSKISLLGTSGGGTMPLKLNNVPSDFKKLVTSPPILEDPLVVDLIKKQDFKILKNSRIFFSAAHKFDFKHYKFLMENLPRETCAENIFNLGWFKKRHDTLNLLLLLGQLRNQLNWLSK